MKNLAIKLVWFTTLFVLVFAGLSQTNIAISTAIVLFIVGQLLVIYMVYTVLKDDYSTTKTFKNWYEDHPRDIINE
ncbi:hypothetical protein [Flavobacterium sp. PL12]|uniref:hypothetical protein n=1 Tax=Flavobacterium sp. PL12 TaxID=3071718 RepID=UPI00319DA4EE